MSEDLSFPDPRWAAEEGLLAVGGDLSPERLLLAYRLGIFPWYGDDEPLLWWSPDPRCVLFPSDVRVSRRLERVLKQKRFTVTCNRAFDQVIEACAAVRIDQDEETWLLPEMQAAYRQLHQLGFAHSIEAWCDGELAGGLYGIALGRFFFGESMFHRQTNASKVVLAHLARYLESQNFELLDCQVTNSHLLSMGAVNITREDFLGRLQRNGLGAAGVSEPVAFPERL